jgi:hypothetical protein
LPIPTLWIYIFKIDHTMIKMHKMVEDVYWHLCNHHSTSVQVGWSPQPSQDRSSSGETSPCVSPPKSSCSPRRPPETYVELILTEHLITLHPSASLSHIHAIAQRAVMPQVPTSLLWYCDGRCISFVFTAA